MCQEHWKVYVKGLREARTDAMPATDDATPTTAGTQRERLRRPMAHAPDPELVKVEVLVAEIDALPGPEAVKRNGDPDVQAALELVGEANGSARREALETPLGEAIASGTEEADAA